MAEPGCNSRLRTGIVGGLNHGDLLQQPIRFGKGPNSRFAILKALFQHPRRLKAEQNVEQFICVAAGQAAGEHRNVAGGPGQCAQSVALRCIPSLQLVNFVGYGVVAGWRRWKFLSSYLSPRVARTPFLRGPGYPAYNSPYFSLTVCFQPKAFKRIFSCS
jgi:hypothetical protein